MTANGPDSGDGDDARRSRRGGEQRSAPDASNASDAATGERGSSSRVDDPTDDGGERTATVLVVDDEADVLEVFAMTLSGAGYDVRTAATGGEALTKLAPEVDVVLLDRRMPGMSGDEVLDHVADWHPDCRVAMVSAVDPGPDIVDMPFDDYLTKPVDAGELVDLVDQLVRFDRYERLLDEYHAVVRKHAVLESHVREKNLDGDALEDLAARRDHLESQLEAVVDGFADETVQELVGEVAPVAD